MQTSQLQKKSFEESSIRTKIPTTFVPLAPEKLAIDRSEVDLMCGVFHIMWSDMPSPRTYGVKLSERLSFDGEYLGCSVVCTFPTVRTISL